MKTKTTLKWLLLPLLVLVCAICSLFVNTGVQAKAEGETTQITFSPSSAVAQDAYGNGNPAMRYLLYVTADQTIALDPTPHMTFSVKKNGEDTGRTIDLPIYDGESGRYLIVCEYAKLTGDDTVTTAAEITDVYLITCAAGSTLTTYTTATDVAFRLSGYDAFNMAAITEFELINQSTGSQDNLKRYLITLKTPVGLAGHADVDVSVSKNGGAEEVKKFTLWRENDAMAYLLIEYGKLTGDTSVESCLKIFDTYKISFKADTLFGGKYSLKNTLTYLISEERCIYMPEKSAEELTSNQFTTTSSSINDDATFARYEIGANTFADIGNHSLVEATLDGEPFSVDIYREGATSVRFLLPYAKIQAGATKASEVGEHEVVIAKGAQIGEQKLASGFIFRFNGAEIEIIDPERLIFRPITVTAGENGTAVADVETAIVDTRITLTITPDARYEVDAIAINGETQTLAGFDGTTFVFTMPLANADVDVSFKLIIVSVSMPTGVIIDSEQSGDMYIDDSYTFTVTPNPGFVLADDAKVLFNGEEVVANEDGSYTVIFTKKANVLSVEGCVPNTFTVTFKDGDTVLKTEEVQFNGKISKYEPTKEGYDFVGWYIGEEEFSTNTVITSDLVLEARFEEAAPVEGDISNETSEDGENAGFGCAASVMDGGMLFVLVALVGAVIAKNALRKQDEE